MWKELCEQDIERVDECPLCYSRNIGFLVKRGDGFPIYECKDCLFAFLRERPSKEALASFYNTNYFQNSETYQDYFNYAQAIIDLKYCPRLHRLHRYLSDFQGKRVLDIGCAAGGTMALLREKGANVLGIEISKSACEIAKDKYKLEVLNCSLEEADLKNDTFDIIFLFDVLEHLANPGETLQRLRQILTSGGTLAITVPNFDRFFEEGQDWIGIQSFWEHLGYFRSEVLQNKLEKMGFEIVDVHTYGSGNKNEPGRRARKVKRELRERYPFFNVFLRITRKIKFLCKGEPDLDIRYDGSGMDTFILGRKE